MSKTVLTIIVRINQKKNILRILQKNVLGDLDEKNKIISLSLFKNDHLKSW